MVRSFLLPRGMSDGRKMVGWIRGGMCGIVEWARTEAWAFEGVSEVDQRNRNVRFRPCLRPRAKFSYLFNTTIQSAIGIVFNLRRRALLGLQLPVMITEDHSPCIPDGLKFSHLVNLVNLANLPCDMSI